MGKRFFVFQEPALAFQASAVTDQRRFDAAADNAMAGHDNADGVGPVGQANSAYRSGSSDTGCQFQVADRLAGWNIAQRGPYRLLEFCTARGNFQFIYSAELSVEVSSYGSCRG